MIKVYAFTAGWVAGRKDGRNVYGRKRDDGKGYPDENDAEYLLAVDEIKGKGLHMVRMTSYEPSNEVLEKLRSDAREREQGEAGCGANRDPREAEA